jgi:thioredoxin-related protein
MLTFLFILESFSSRVFRSAEKREMILLENENKFMKKKQKSYILVARENADFGVENLYRPPGSSIHALSRS